MKLVQSDFDGTDRLNTRLVKLVPSLEVFRKLNTKSSWYKLKAGLNIQYRIRNLEWWSIKKGAIMKLTNFQYYWTLLFMVVPSVYTGIISKWWYWPIAFVIILIIHGLVGWLSIITLPMKFLKYTLHLKAPIIGFLFIILVQDIFK